MSFSQKGVCCWAPGQESVLHPDVPSLRGSEEVRCNLSCCLDIYMKMILYLFRNKKHNSVYFFVFSKGNMPPTNSLNNNKQFHRSFLFFGNISKKCKNISLTLWSNLWLALTLVKQIKFAGVCNKQQDKDLHDCVCMHYYRQVIE